MRGDAKGGAEVSGRDHITWQQIGVGYLVVLLVLAAVVVALLQSSGAVDRTASDILGYAVVAVLVGLGALLRPVLRWFSGAYFRADPELERRFKIGATGLLCVTSLATTAVVVAASIRLNF
jgi:hypothetical protein